MKTKNTSFIFACGALLGLSLALCLGAVEKTKTAAPEPAKKDWSKLKFVAYPNGGTGIFDPDSGTIYVYDSDLQNCYLVRQITTLGERTTKP